jgi:proteasome lid subunit RPN8/RPN11
MLGLSDGHLTAYFPARNEFASPQRFQIESSDQIRIYNELLSRDEEPAIYHSHPHTEGRPSQTDINLARDWPGSPWVICSLAGDEPLVRAFTIDGNEVKEVELDVD